MEDSPWIMPRTLSIQEEESLKDMLVEQTLGQHQQDNAITYLGVKELLRDDESREEELDLIPTHL